MNEKEKQRLNKKFKITSVQRGLFEDGFYSGLRCAERHYKKAVK